MCYEWLMFWQSQYGIFWNTAFILGNPYFKKEFHNRNNWNHFGGWRPHHHVQDSWKLSKHFQQTINIFMEYLQPNRESLQVSYKLYKHSIWVLWDTQQILIWSPVFPIPLLVFFFFWQLAPLLQWSYASDLEWLLAAVVQKISFTWWNFQWMLLTEFNFT